MFCRRAWQRVGPLARRSFKPPCRNAPVRHMSFGVPGGSTNMTYFVLCGGGLTAALVYAYKTVNSDSERYEDRLANMGTTAKASAPAATPVEEASPVVEAITESVPITAEPVAETSAELVVEAGFEEAAAVTSDVVIEEVAAEPAVTDEAAPPAAVEDAAEAAPVADTVETPEEVPAAESTGMAAVDEVLLVPPAEAETPPAAAEAEAAPAADVAA